MTKFKLRTSRYLFTFKVDDKVKAEKIMQSIPPTLKKETINWGGNPRLQKSDGDLFSDSAIKSLNERERMCRFKLVWTQLVLVP